MLSCSFWFVLCYKQTLSWKPSMRVDLDRWVVADDPRREVSFSDNDFDSLLLSTPEWIPRQQLLNSKPLGLQNWETSTKEMKGVGGWEWFVSRLPDVTDLQKEDSGVLCLILIYHRFLSRIKTVVLLYKANSSSSLKHHSTSFHPLRSSLSSYQSSRQRHSLRKSLWHSSTNHLATRNRR